MQAMAAYGVGDQKQAFQDRLKRINSGRQYEHEDVIGFRTQKAYETKLAPRLKKPRRTLGQRIMVMVAFMSGALSFMLARLAYFHLSQIHGMPEAFVNLGGRGVFLMTLVIAGFLAVSLHLATRGRMQALALGCALMYFGEPAVAMQAPGLWDEMFSPAYTAEIKARAPQLPNLSVG